jgi:hypothetical protein
MGLMIVIGKVDGPNQTQAGREQVIARKIREH